MEIEKVFYSRGTALQAIIGVPDASEKVRPAVVLCHGHSRHKNDGLDRLSELLVAAGYITLRMDFRGCGRQAADRYNLYCGMDWCEDLMSAISYLKSVPIVDADRIGAAGISMGACTVVNTTGMDQRIKSTVAMAGIGDCYHWLEWVWQQNNGDFGAFLELLEQDSILAAATGKSRAVNALEMYHKPKSDRDALQLETFFNSDVNSYVTLNAIKSLLSYKPLEKCPYITTPIFFAYGGCDDIVPARESKQMYEAVSSAVRRIRMYEGMEHNLPMDPRHDEVFTDIVNWFQETL